MRRLYGFDFFIKRVNEYNEQRPHPRYRHLIQVAPNEVMEITWEGRWEYKIYETELPSESTSEISELMRAKL